MWDSLCERTLRNLQVPKEKLPLLHRIYFFFRSGLERLHADRHR